jgi:metal-responsive CopG/Arc/MetJ family transcriptional regulator
MLTYGINNATASLHLRLPKSMLAEMKVIAAKEDAGGMSALVRRAVRQYILMQRNLARAPVTTRQESSEIPQQPSKNESVDDELQRARATHNLYFRNEI